MNPNDARVEAIFHAALDLSDHAERDAFIGRECADDIALEARVRRLLGSHDHSGLLRAAAAALLPEVEAELARLKPEEAGERIGPYKLLQQIGEGGFGVVWMAEQEQPVRRRVALKIIKMGMDTKEIIARFEQERQALAMMEHPNIAKVFDAGATQYGRPFFVMELVRGIRITDYCDQHNLPTAERLHLFIAVCQAVQHAHQKGIIHRDLKPSNILVTLHDGVPVPKVIDFGVAKATQARLTERTLFTQFQQMIGTPLYMSPEQAEMSGLDIDTRSDIYSLGVLLYELLTGRTPIDTATMAQAGMDEIRRIIREQEPVKPSTALQTLAADARTTVARNRDSDAAKLTGLLRGDLDWIVMKALEKDRARRYDSATAFAEDLRRHLTFEPVLARPPSRLYRFRRMVKRNKLAFAAGTAIAFTLLGGFIVSSVFLIIAREKMAETEKARRGSERVAGFLKEMLKGVGPAAAEGRDPAMLREILDQAAARLDTELKDEPRVRAELYCQIGRIYEDFGEFARAEDMIHKAFETMGGVGWVDGSFLFEMYDARASALRGQGKFAEAEELYRQTLALQRMEKTPDNAAVANTLNNLGTALKEQHKLPEAEAMFRESLTIYKTLPDLGNGTAAPINNLGNVLRAQGKSTEAEALYRESLALERKFNKPGHRNVAASLSNIANLLLEQGQFAEAEGMLREALSIEKKVLVAEHPQVQRTMNNLAKALSAAGKLDEAGATLREVLAASKKLHGAEHGDVADALERLAEVLEKQEKPAEAESLYRKALAILRKLPGEEHREVAGTLTHLDCVLFSQEKFGEAEAMEREALAIRKKLLGEEHADIALSLNNLARTLSSQGKLEEAEALDRASLALRKKLLGEVHTDTARSRDMLAGVLKKQRKFGEAEAVYRESLAIQKRLRGEDHADVAQALDSVASMLRKQDKWAEAEAVYREILAMRKKLHGGETAEVADALSLLAGALIQQDEWAEAEHLMREAVAIWKKLGGDKNDELAHALKILTLTLTAQEKSAEAEAPALETLAIQQKLSGEADPEVVEARTMLVAILLSRGQFSKARPHAEQAVAMYRSHPDWNSKYRRSAFQLLDAILVTAGDKAGHRALQREIAALPAAK